MPEALRIVVIDIDKCRAGPLHIIKRFIEYRFDTRVLARLFAQNPDPHTLKRCGGEPSDEIAAPRIRFGSRGIGGVAARHRGE